MKDIDGINKTPFDTDIILQRYMGVLLKTDSNICQNPRKDKYEWEVESGYKLYGHWDETLILLDDRSYLKGPSYIPAVVQMRDDTLNNILGQAVKEKKVFGIIDSCHSAGMFDLDYMYTEDAAYSESEDVSKDLSIRVTDCQRIAMLSGCRSDQSSTATAKGSMLTNILLEFFRETYYSSTITIQHLHRHLLEEMKNKGLSQRPIFSASRDDMYYFPMYSGFFINRKNSSPQPRYMDNDFRDDDEIISDDVEIPLSSRAFRTNAINLSQILS
jgi:hypothetical protein